MAEAKSSSAPPQQTVLFPAETEDYRVVEVDVGLGLVANRNIKKGTIIFNDSLLHDFSHVVEGDRLLMDYGYNPQGPIPQYVPLTKDMLTRTHGVPTFVPDPSGETGGTVTWVLEVPGMLMNHSCDPNCVDYLTEDGEVDTTGAFRNVGESRATRDIRKGEEIRWDYALTYYDRGPFFDPCRCGAANCRGKMMGFKDLTNEQKEALLPKTNAAIQAMHRADTGVGPPVRKHQGAISQRDTKDVVYRLVCPSPGCDDAEVEVKEEKDGSFALYALRNYSQGEVVFSFWCQSWPRDVPVTFDMVFSKSYTEYDPEEGTVIRIENASKQLGFSGWELLAKADDDSSSSEPNLVHKAHDQDWNWRSAYAATDIKKGDVLTADYSQNRSPSSGNCCPLC